MEILAGIILVLAGGFAFGALAGRVGLPRLTGMLLFGIAAGPSALDIIPESLMELSPTIRLAVLSIILFKAGLGLDRRKLQMNGAVAGLIGVLPALLESVVVALLAHLLFDLPLLVAWLLGWVVAAESPAVIVPSMLRLKSRGLGTEAGVPDIVLAGSAVSDAVAITMFGVVLGILEGGVRGAAGIGGSTPLFILLQTGLGIVAGCVGAWLLMGVLRRMGRGAAPASYFAPAAITIFLLVVLADEFAVYSPYLAVITAGFLLAEIQPRASRKLRGEADRIWWYGEIFLFVLIGASVDISAGVAVIGPGLLLLAAGLLFGRLPGIALSAVRSKLSLLERVYLGIAMTPKATVQAAIGAIPLAAGIAGGELILSIAVLAILVTAPLGALASRVTAPVLLQPGRVDPSRVDVAREHRYMVVVDEHPESRAALEHATRTARSVDGMVTILHISTETQNPPANIPFQEELAYARDVDTEIIVRQGAASEVVLQEVAELAPDCVYIGRKGRKADGTRADSAFIDTVIEHAAVPVMLIDTVGEGAGDS